jgi:hypothetical protein
MARKEAGYRGPKIKTITSTEQAKVKFPKLSTFEH